MLLVLSEMFVELTAATSRSAEGIVCKECGGDEDGICE